MRVFSWLNFYHLLLGSNCTLEITNLHYKYPPYVHNWMEKVSLRQGVITALFWLVFHLRITVPTSRVLHNLNYSKFPLTRKQYDLKLDANTHIVKFQAEGKCATEKLCQKSASLIQSHSFKYCLDDPISRTLKSQNELLELWVLSHHLVCKTGWKSRIWTLGFFFNWLALLYSLYVNYNNTSHFNNMLQSTISIFHFCLWTSV